uniref:Uncharacterized protein n=1 Tax=Lygus hesperus TaxID=30085 RepID=A0A146L0Y6_LYGHE
MLIRVLAVFAFVAVVSAGHFLEHKREYEFVKKQHGQHKRVFEFVKKCPECAGLKRDLHQLDQQTKAQKRRLDSLLTKIARNSKVWMAKHLEHVKKEADLRAFYYTHVKQITIKIQEAKALISKLKEQRRKVAAALKAAKRRGREQATQPGSHHGGFWGGPIIKLRPKIEEPEEYHINGIPEYRHEQIIPQPMPYLKPEFYPGPGPVHRPHHPHRRFPSFGPQHHTSHRSPKVDIKLHVQAQRNLEGHPQQDYFDNPIDG